MAVLEVQEAHRAALNSVSARRDVLGAISLQLPETQLSIPDYGHAIVCAGPLN
jgi:hypothetical protein